MKLHLNRRVIVIFSSLIALGAVAGLIYLKRSKSGEPAPAYSGTPTVTVGIGVMGDSMSDEYRADDARGGPYGPHTLNWVEQLVITRGLNFGSWGTWGEPRRTGYEYNWARSGATAYSLIESGQHIGLAKQVAEGKVSIVVLWIGNNDFHLANGTYQAIYDGSLSDQGVKDKVNGILSNITTAVDTVRAAGDVDMIIVNIADKSIDPRTKALFPDSSKLKRVSNAIKAVNAGIDKLAKERGIVVINSNDLAFTLLTRMDLKGYLHVGDQKIDFKTRGNSPAHIQLDDYSGHAGTVLSGLLANWVFIQPLDKKYGFDIPPLTDEEILKNAGLK